MEEFTDRKQQTLDLLQRTISFAHERGAPEVAEELEEASRRLSDGRLFVVVCGEFKRGKSSLVNAFLEDRDLLPVDVDIATRLVTTVSHGEREEILVWTGDGRAGKPRAISRGEIPTYVAVPRDPGKGPQARLLTIQTPNEKLKQGLVLVDTPGVGGIYNEHSEITFAFIPNADVILFVSDALSPLSTEELDFLARRIVPQVSEMLFVVTKIDQVLDYQTVIESDRERLAAVLQRPPGEISILPVSSSNKLSYLTSRDEEDLEDSRFPQLEAELWRLLQERGAPLLLIRALKEAAVGLAHLRGPLAAELDALKETDREQLARQEAQLRQAQQRLSELLDHNAHWRSQLSYGLQDVRKDILATEVERRRVRLQHQLDEYLEDERLLRDPGKIYFQVKVDLQSVYTELFRQAVSAAAALQEHIESTSQIALNPYQVPATDLSAKLPDVPTVAGRSKETFWRKTLEVGRYTSVSAAGGTLIGSVLGGLLGGIVGFFVGGVGAGPGATLGSLLGGAAGQLAGMGTGARQALENLRQREREKVRRECRTALNPFVQESFLLCRSELERALTEIERWMSDDFQAKLLQEKKALERSIEAFQRGRQTSQLESDRRIQVLEESLHRLEELESRYHEQLSLIVALHVVRESAQEELANV